MGLFDFLKRRIVSKDNKQVNPLTLQQKRFKEMQKRINGQDKIDREERQFRKKKAKCIEKYGEELGTKIAKGYLWIGMNEEALIAIKGLPKKKSKWTAAGVAVPKKVIYQYGSERNINGSKYIVGDHVTLNLPDLIVEEWNYQDYSFLKRHLNNGRS